MLISARLCEQHVVTSSCTLIVASLPVLYAAVFECMFTLLDVCVSSLRRGHANHLFMVPIVTNDPRRESCFCMRADRGCHGRPRLPAGDAHRLRALLYYILLYYIIM